MKSKKQGNNTININIPSLLKHNRKRAPVTLTAPVNILHKVKVDGRFKNGGMKPWNPIYALFKYTWEVSAEENGNGKCNVYIAVGNGPNMMHQEKQILNYKYEYQ
eukprot:507915_1